MCAFSALILWVLWPVKNRRPYNLYCVGEDVKPCSINQSINECSSSNWLVTDWLSCRLIYCRNVDAEVWQLSEEVRCDSLAQVAAAGHQAAVLCIPLANAASLPGIWTTWYDVPSLSLSVRLSVTLKYYVKTAKHIVIIASFAFAPMFLKIVWPSYLGRSKSDKRANAMTCQCR